MNDIEQEYKEYLIRAEFYGRHPMSLDEFRAWCERWHKEYDTAWKSGPDWSTINELETALCV